MKISSKGRYALRMLLDLAKNKEQGYISLKDIAERQNISKKYLEQIIPIINRPSILKVNRGTQGGYRLAKDPQFYTLAEILTLTEGSLAPVDLEDDQQVSREDGDVLYEIWQGLYLQITTYLEKITLQDLVDRETSLIANDYVI